MIVVDRLVSRAAADRAHPLVYRVVTEGDHFIFAGAAEVPFHRLPHD
jgi:hypothetical protein